MPVSEQTFYLDPTSQETLQHQIQQMVIEGILSGRLTSGARMPSSRRLARHLGISRITVTLAYTELVSNDYLTSRGRSGYFVSETAPQPPMFKPKGGPVNDTVDWARILPQRNEELPGPTRPADWRQMKYPFIYGQTDATLFDHQNWRLCALRALGRRDFEALTADYYQSDDAKLIEFILRHILPRRGISAEPDEVLLTLGAQNALWLSAQTLLNQRRTAAIENPCYPGIRQVLAQTRSKRVLINVDAHGLPPDALPDAVDVVFTTPSHQAPTNTTMPLERRKALLERANQQDFLVVEDDYEFEINFARSPSPALKSLDRNGRVIYIGSFSKSLFPGLRLGYLVGSRAFIQEARALRANVLRHPPGHIQRTVAYFLSLGHYDSQILRIGRAYASRREVMARSIAKLGLTMEHSAHQGGSSFWMRAPAGVDTTALALDLRAHGVLIEPGRAFFPPEDHDNRHYRLAYSSIPAERIEEGLEILAEQLA